MKVLLVYPKPNRVTFDTTHCLPLGLGYLAAVLEQAGHHVEVLDLNVQPDHLEQRVQEAQIVGLYTITATARAAWALCQRIKEANPDTVTVLGGPHPTVLPEESLAQEGVDIVVRGEAEETLPELCHALEDGKALAHVAGISYRVGKDIHHNPDRPPPRDLDALPFPAVHLFPFHAYRPTRPTWIDMRGVVQASIMTSRGCPFTCNFCTSARGRPGAKPFRARSPENVIEEIKFLVKDYGVNFIEMQDDAFNLIPQRAKDICRLIIREGLNIRWSIPNGLSRVENVDREFLELARASGCIDVWYAAESGAPRIRDAVIGKQNTMAQVRDAVALSKEVGFKVGAFFVLGNPDETREEMKATIDFACSLPLDKVQFTIATPFPGTTYYDMACQEGRLLVRDWDLYGPYENVVFFEYGAMTKEVVEEMYRLAFRRFFLRPSYIARTLTTRTTYTNLPLLLRQAWYFMT